MKFLRGLLRALGALLFLIVALVLVLKVVGLVMFKDFYKETNKEFKIPGLSENFIPQGLTYDEKEESFITGGYVKGGNSTVYVTKDKKSSAVTMYDTNNVACTDHFGGCAVYKDYLLVTGGDGDSEGIDEGKQFIYTFKLSDIYDGDGKATAISTSKIITGGAFIYVLGDIAYVGEFNHDGSKYVTPESHHVGENKAIMLSYSLNADGTLAAKPTAAYSITNDIQGMCFTDSGKVCMSASWGVQPSVFYVYSNLPEAKDSITLHGETLPLGTFTEAEVTYKSSPMMEEITYFDGRVYVMNESSSCKYIFGNLFRGSYVYSKKLA